MTVFDCTWCDITASWAQRPSSRWNSVVIEGSSVRCRTRWRADVPTVGERTIRNAAAAGCACIAVGAGEVIIVDKPDTLKLADELGVAIIGVPRPA